MRLILAMMVLVTLADPAGALAGITGTKHDLVPSSGAGTRDAKDVACRCRICHQVHGTAGGSGGLWVRSWPKETASPRATAGAPVGTPIATPRGTPDVQRGDRSRKCLSCHDGTVARNVPTGRRGMAPGNVPGGRHPNGMPFAGQRGSDAAVDQYAVASVSTCAARTPVCVQGGSDPAAGAYVKLLGGAGAYRVECSSCHDPHLDNLDGRHPHFLRVPDTTSRDPRCGACHKR